MLYRTFASHPRLPTRSPPPSPCTPRSTSPALFTPVAEYYQGQGESSPILKAGSPTSFKSSPTTSYCYDYYAPPSLKDYYEYVQEASFF